MIKGVTKNVIEINNMNSEYFEKAIVILKDNCIFDEDQLKAEARLALGSTPAFIKSLGIRIKIKMLICTLSGALAAILFCGIAYLFSGS